MVAPPSGPQLVLSTNRPAPTLAAWILETDTGRHWHGVEHGGQPFWAPPPGTSVCRLGATAGVALLAGDWVAHPLDVVGRDILAGFTSAQPTRFTPSVPGVYHLFGSAYFDGGGSGVRHVCWFVNGAVWPGSTNNESAVSGATSALVPRQSQLFLNGITDYVELGVMRTGGSGGTTVVDGYAVGVALNYAGL